MRSAGRPVMGCEVRIVDEHGAEVPVGETGQITARGSMMMDGYWNKPEETAKAIMDGWLMTGDAGRMDEDGYLYILDRVKDMIISGGENIYSTEVENALSTFPGVVMCAVIGKADPEWGETVHAVIQTADGAHLDEGALGEHCKALIAGYKRPRSYEFVSALPLSPAGKILKRDLRDATGQT
ncbi:MAG: AMP-binding protein [Rhodobacteraceae bacterium]|nr:AMP-binding protein [Paracoccaceae bacterium]